MEEQIYRGHHEKITRVVKQVNSTNLYIYIYVPSDSGRRADCVWMRRRRGGIGVWSIEKERVGRAVNLPGPLDR